MSMRIFTKEDFSIEDLMHHQTTEIMFQHFADKCNRKMDEIVKSWPKAYGKEGFWDIERKSKHTFQCHLAFIEEIKKEPCKHEPENFEFKIHAEGYLPASPGHYQVHDSKGVTMFASKCKHCGVELQAHWEIKEK